MSENMILTDKENLVIEILQNKNSKDSIDKKVKEIIFEFFGDVKVNHRNGLNNQYNLLKQKVIKENLISYILYGMNSGDTFINDYITNKMKVIRLNTTNICKYLLIEYFTSDEINHCCDILISINIAF